MRYGYCANIDDYSWSITYGTIPLGMSDEMFTNVTLIRTLSEKFYGAESEYHNIINSILCFDDFFVKSFSVSLTAKEIYYWKPKEARVDEGEVINYNAPCEDDDEARELRGCKGSFSCAGIGNPSCETIASIISAANSVAMKMDSVSGFSQTGNSHQSNINSWETSVINGQLESFDNMRNSELTSHNMSVGGLMGINDSYMVSTSKVQLFTDIAPSTVNFNSVKNILISRAGVGCKETVR